MRWMGVILLAFSLPLASPVAAKRKPPPAMSPPVPLPAPQNCALPEHRQFDFWIGNWEVRQTRLLEEMTAASLVESVAYGCGLRETWMPFSRIQGSSLTTYDPRDKLWRQTWVDANNARVEFQGGLKDGKMVLQGLWRGLYKDGRDGLMRMSFERIKDGWIRQIGEVSADEGKTWQPSFDFTYVPRQP